jgi:hypothetical protein
LKDETKDDIPEGLSGEEARQLCEQDMQVITDADMESAVKFWSDWFDEPWDPEEEED